MIRIELVRDPDGREDDFTIIDYDGDLKSYNETEFKVDIEKMILQSLIMMVT